MIWLPGPDLPVSSIPQSQTASSAYRPDDPALAVLLHVLQQAAGSSADVSLWDGIDWGRLLQAASHHGVSSVLGRALRTTPLPLVAREQLQAAERNVAQHGLRLTGVLGEVIHALDQKGVRSLAYKGPVLSQQLFQDPAVREAVDLDLLIAPADLERAIASLSDIGFTPIRSYPASSFPQLVRYRAEYGMERDEVLVELQWRLAPLYFSAPFDFESAWQARTLVTIAGRPISTLAPELNLLALCVHGTKHQWERLKWIFDLDLCIRQQPRLDWESIETTASRYGLRGILLTSLATCRLLLNTPLPSHLSEVFTGETVDAAQAFIAGLNDKHAVGEMQHHRTMLRLRERGRDRWSYLARLAVLPTEQEWDLVSLPRGLAWMYYALRLARVAGKAFKALFSA